MVETDYDVGKLNLLGRSEILEHLDTVPSARSGELICEIDACPATVFSALKQLKEFGLVEKKDGYRITPKGRKILPAVREIKRYSL